MIFFVAFLIFLSIYEIYYILHNCTADKKKMIILYCVMATAITMFAWYYYQNRFGNSFSYYIFKMLNISY